MKRQHLIVALSVLTVVGSLFMMLSSNMFFSDILNAGAGGLLGSLSVSLPAISVTMFFVIAVLYLLRLYKKPGCKKRLTRLYSILLMVLAFLGILGDILAGATYYKTFVGPNPFPGYLIIFLILNLLLLGGSIFALIKATKMEADAEKTRIGFPYVMKTLGWFLFICLVFNRFGTFLTSPVFIYWRNFHQTFPFYLFLPLPLFLGVLECSHILGLTQRKTLLILVYVAIGLDVVLVGYTAVMGINDTLFISSLSQAMPLERMASKPLELPIHFLSCLGVSIALLLQNRKPRVKH